MITPFRAESSSREAAVMAIVAAVLVGLPWFLPLIGGYSELATQIVLWGIFALGFDLLLGFTGLLSFGHAAFWGLGSYAAGLMLLRVTENLLPAIVVGIFVAGAASLVLGYLTLRRRGIYFSILTLAFAEMLYYAALAPLQDWTGGDNGLTGIPAAHLLGIDMRGMPIYFTIAAFAFISIYLARRIARSPYGLILRAIKSNETRLASTGIDTRRYKLMAFVISGLYAGLAGSLSAVYQTYVPTDALHWTTSGEIVMMAVIGGVGTLFGPMLGAGIVLFLENVLSATIPQWLLIQGLIFMAFVIFLPGGVIDAARRLIRAVSPRPAPVQVQPKPVAEAAAAEPVQS
jgi:ABC-type branched-subunit amino acid transport system permease subunit